jgi:polysaccharide biosynthesis/export protein
MNHLLLTLVLMVITTTGDVLAMQASAPDKSTNYIVGPQDVLKVTVFDEPQLSGSFRVDSDGSFTYPFLGRIQGVGQTVRTLEAELTRMLADGYVRRPQVSIEVEQYRSRSVYIVGEVRSPGKYPLVAEMTLIEALAQAGSTTLAAGSEVVILHPAHAGPAGPELVTGSQRIAQTTHVSLVELQAGKFIENVVLHEGDTVFVPRAERFYVTGQVKTPGAYVFEHGMTVLQALSLAGGLSEKGSNRGIKVIRLIDGQKKELDIKLSDLVQPNDTLIIRQRLL